MPRIAALALAAGFAATALDATELVTLDSTRSVDEVTAALVAAVENAGARVFATVDHGAGAASVDMPLGAAKLVIFGNPRLGTPALQDDIHAGLVLPLRVLIYEADGGATHIAYEDPASLFEGLEIDASAAYVDAMRTALGNLTGTAAGS